MGHTPETKAKISQSKKGKRCSISTEFKKGGTSWNKGKVWSSETKEKMRQAKLKNPTRYWLGKERPDFQGENNPNSGKFGQRHPKYVKNKRHPFHKAIRETYKYKNWRNGIFTRDNFLCVLCGNGGELNADHYPVRFIDIINKLKPDTVEDTLEYKELWDVKNGRTLCRKCHEDTPTWGRRIKKN